MAKRSDRIENPPRDLRCFELPGTDLLVLSMAADDGSGLADLSESEVDIALRLLDGESLRQIARARGSTLRTVSKQVGSLYRKLGVHSRSELTVKLTG
jgi:DNA-binding NarL/FixJ family response regulator